MKKLFAVLPLAIAAATCAPAQSTAPSVVLNGLGSSALFLEAGLGTTLTPVGATCWWTGNNSSTAGNVVTAKDTKNSTAGVTDTGNAWVAWTTGTGTGASCATPVGPGVQVWSYLQTDSVVGNRCLFNAQGTTPTCSISYPTTAPASAGLLFPANDSTKVETALPNSIATALNSAKVNYAGTDIRPEDAEFAATAQPQAAPLLSPAVRSIWVWVTTQRTRIPTSTASRASSLARSSTRRCSRSPAPSS